MASPSDHARTLFSAIVPDRKDLLGIALEQLSQEHFPDREWYNLYVIFSWYHSIAGDVLTRQAVSDAIRKLPDSAESKVRLYEEIYDNLLSSKASESDFRWSLEQLKDSFAARATKAALLEAMNIAQQGIPGPKGDVIKGHEAARDRIMAQFAEIDLRAQVQEAPDGNAREEEDDILAEYAQKKAKYLSGESSGVEFGVSSIDKYLGGLQPGELDFVLGYSSSGKSSLCVQLAWNCAMAQGKNVIYVTTETLRSQIRRKLISRHSMLPQFDLPEGLNSLDLKRGTLEASLEEKLREVVRDFSSNASYGQCRIMQASENTSVSALKIGLQRLQTQTPIDLVIVDSLYILRPDERRSTEREELNDAIKKAKHLATTFNNGNGVPFVTPWQTSREHKERADRDKRYAMSAMAETAYAERYADVVISLLEPPESKRFTTLTAAIIKNRDGEQSPNLDVKVDYATSCFTDSSGFTSGDFNNLLGFKL